MAEFSNLTDEELIALLKDDDVAVLEEIYNRYWKKLYNTAYKRLRNTDHCEEFVQDVFTALWANRAEVKIEAGLGFYLYTAIKNSIIDFHRREIMRENYPFAKRVLATDDTMEDDIHLKDLKTKTDLMIRLLPLQCHSVFILSRTEQKTNLEIAALLNMSEKAVEGQLTKALKYLRTSLNQFVVFGLIGMLSYLL